VHRSVLENAAYVKYARENTVEVICMEEIERAEKENAKTIATYKSTDAYGDEEHYLTEFPGLTLDQLKRISDTEAVLRFMDGGKIPYTAIVDPHTGKAIEAIKGKPTVKSLKAAIDRARQQLEKEHGKGLDRKLWDELRASEVECDKLLIAEQFDQALALHEKLAKKHEDAKGFVKNRLDAMKRVIDKDIAKAKAAKDS